MTCSFDSCTYLYDVVFSEFSTVSTSDRPKEISDVYFSAKECLEGHDSEVKCCAWHLKKSLIATCSRDKTVWIWINSADAHGMPSCAANTQDFDLESSHESSGSVIAGDSRAKDELMYTSTLKQEHEVLCLLEGHTQDVKFVAWHPSKDELYSCGYDETIRIWCPKKGVYSDEWDCPFVLQEHLDTVWKILFEENTSGLTEYMVTCGSDERIILWFRPRFFDESSAKCQLWTISDVFQCLNEGPIYSVDWGPLDLVAYGGADGHVGLCKIRRNQTDNGVGKKASLFYIPTNPSEEDHEGALLDVAWRRDTRDAFLASVGEDGHLKIWHFVRNTENTI